MLRQKPSDHVNDVQGLCLELCVIYAITGIVLPKWSLPEVKVDIEKVKLEQFISLDHRRQWWGVL